MKRLGILVLIWLLSPLLGGLCCHAQQQLSDESQESSPQPPALVVDDTRNSSQLIEESTKLEFQKKPGVVYRQTNRYQLKCDLYIPEGQGPFPAIIAVHGGAWRMGTKFALLRHAWLMAQSGYVVVAIDYRHAPEYPFPAQVHDCKHAVRWTKANASKYKIDASRIGAFGYSAGGHLVSILGTTDAKDGLEGEIEAGLEEFDSRIKAVAAGGAPCEFSWIDKNSNALSYWLGGTRKKEVEKYKAASPTTYVTSDDPPFFFFHGDLDMVVSCETSLILHRLLQKSNVPSQHFLATGAGHLGTFSELEWMEKAIEFFDANLTPNSQRE